MPINKNSRIQYSINTTLPYILPTLNYVDENNDNDIKRTDVRHYIVQNYSQGKSPRSEMDIVSKIIDRYLEEDEKKIILLGDLGTALLKTWKNHPQTRDELLLIGFSQHFIVEFTIKEIHGFLMNGKRKITAEDLKRKVKALDIYPDLAKNIESNVTEILKDLIRLHILPEKDKNTYIIDFYKPTDLGLLYSLLYYFPEWKTINIKSLKQSDLLKILLTDIIKIKRAFTSLNTKNLARYEAFADIEKYIISIDTIKDLNERL